MSIDTLLTRLDKVKSAGANKWLACCPSHVDKTPSLAIKLIDDGKILLKCFGCGAGAIEIIQALGLSPDELFPQQPDNERGGYTRERKPFPAELILKALLHETTILCAAAHDICKGIKVSDTDWQRIELARERINQAVYYAKT